MTGPIDNINRYQTPGVMPVGYEAQCTACGATFNPSGDEAMRLDGRPKGQLYVEHYCTDDGVACGGWGEVLGGWTILAEQGRRIIPLEEARRLIFAPALSCYGCCGTGKVQGFGHTGDRCQCVLHETGECEPGMCSPECQAREERRDEAEGDYHLYGTERIDVEAAAEYERLLRALTGGA